MIIRQIRILAFLLQTAFLCPIVCTAQNPGDNYTPFMEDGKWGYFDQFKNVVISPRFEGAEIFHNGLAFVTVNDKDGLINSNGEFMLEPVYSNLDKYKGDECAMPYTIDAFSHGLKFVSDFKNLDYTIVKILKIDSTTSSHLLSNHKFEIFNPDGEPMKLGKITDIKYPYYTENDELKYKILFKSDSICYYWNEFDSIYSLGVYDEVNWTAHSNYLKTSKDSCEFIIDKRGMIIYKSYLHSLSIETNTNKAVIRVWNKNELKKYVIENMKPVLIGTYASDYDRFPTQFGYEEVRSNGIYHLYSKFGDLIEYSKSDESIIHNKKYMILSMNGVKSIYRISDGERLNDLSFCSAHFANDELVIASFTSCKEGLYIDNHLLVRGEVKNKGVFNVDGEMIIDAKYDIIEFCSEILCFICIKDKLKSYYDLKGNLIFKSKPISLESCY